MSSFVDRLNASTKMKESVEVVERLIKDITGTIDKAGKPWLVTIPTPATLMEAIVGECDACEEFIQSRRANCSTSGSRKPKPSWMKLRSA